MFLPLGTDRPLTRPTLITHALIGLNVAVFVWQLASMTPQLGLGNEPVSQMLRLEPGHLARAWTLVTYAFLHGGFMHIAGNLFFLWAFGPNVEDRLGRAGFLAFYLVAAAAAGLAHAAATPASVIGASGAIAGVTGAYLVLFPRTKIKALIVFFIIGIFMIPASWFIGAQIFWNVVVTGMGRSGNVATIAHLGGYGFGFAVGWVLLAARILPREPYDLFTISKQAKRRRQFREIAFQSRRREQRVLEGKERGPMGVDTDTADRIASMRADVATKLSRGEPEAAARAYRQLLEEHGSTPGAGVLSRDKQYELANHLFRLEDYQTAAIAYQRLIDAYPKHDESGQIRLMLGRINARYLNDPIRARQLLNQAIDELGDEQMIEMARKELEALG